MRYPSPDNFDDIYAQADENLTWSVIGYGRDDNGNLKFQDIEVGFKSKALAEAFIRVYTEKYVKEMFFNPSQDC